MLVLSKKFGVIILLTWFAILQALAPFNHQHVGEDNQASPNRLHIHALESAINNLSVESQDHFHPIEGFIVSANKIILTKHKVFTSPEDEQLNAFLIIGYILLLSAFISVSLVFRKNPLQQYVAPYDVLQHSRAPPSLLKL